MAILAGFLGALSILVAPSHVATRPASRAERGTFILLMKGETVMSDRFSRTSQGIEGRMMVGGSPWQNYSMTLDPDQNVRGARIDMYPPHASTQDTATMHVTADLRGDSIRVGHSDRGGIEKRSFPASRNTLIGVNASVAFLEQVVRRVHVLGNRSPSEVAIFLPEHGQLWKSTVTRMSSDSTKLVLGGDEWHFATDREGRILGGWSTGNIQIRRVPDVKGR